MARPAPPSNDGSPARLIATMVGIVGILLLGSLAWSAVGALASAVGSAGQALIVVRTTPTLAPAVAATPTAILIASPTPIPLTPTLMPSPTTAPTAEPVATPTAESAKRNPWVLLPQPEPNSHVPPGPITIEARGRGDAPITSIRLDVDGASLPVSLEQRSESTWRGFATTRVAPGQHAVKATVTDAEGRVGSYRWNFAVGP